MKSIFKTLLCLVSFLVPVTGLFAQVGEEQDVPDVYHYPDNEDGTGIVYSKIVQGPNEKGEYTIFLKSFVTGQVDEQTMAIPTEVVLVLDVSGSMDWGMTDADYTANNAQYSYNTINNSSTMYLYKYNGEYLRVYAGTSYYGDYCLYTVINRVPYYFTQNGGLTTDGNQAYWRDRADRTIFNGTLYTVTAGHSRIAALKEAVNYFITEINNNSGTLPAGKTNKISIVKFANDSFCNSNGTAVNYNTGASDSNATGNHRGADNNSAYNYTEFVNGFLSSSSSSLSTNVNGLIAGGATAADYGMIKAELLINTLFNNPNTNPTPKELTNKIVVFFTDGEPTHSSSFEDDVANDAITIAKRLKAMTAYEYTNETTGTTVTGKVKVYTIGTFVNPSTKTETYMNRLSSNYPNATGIGEGGGGADGSDLNGFYFLASNKEQLIHAFGEISNDVVSPDITVNSSSTVVDVMSKSFTLPTGTDPSTVQVWETKAQSYNTTTNQYVFSTDKDHWQNITNAQGLILDVDDATNKVKVSGWAFDKNACARKSDGSVVGKQLILEIPIEMGPNAVGGPGVGTNGAGSGISYVDENGVTQTLHFETPNIGLPINIHIRKEGLQLGESAKFTIQRMWDGESDIPDDVVITPDTWEDYTSVFVTRRSTNTESGDNAPIVKIVGLHPGFIYRIKEEGWSWSYGVSRVHGSKYTINPETHVETTEDITMNNGTQADWSDNTVLSTSINLNPFIFVNAKKDVESSVVSVRHAESIVTNDFKDFGDTGTKTGVTVNSKTQPE